MRGLTDEMRGLTDEGRIDGDRWQGITPGHRIGCGDRRDPGHTWFGRGCSIGSRWGQQDPADLQPSRFGQLIVHESDSASRWRWAPGSRKRAWHERDFIVSATSSGERILLYLPTGTYLHLDDSAARIVGLLNQDPDPVHAADHLVHRFQIPFDRALGDVNAVIAACSGQSGQRQDRGRRPTVSGFRVVAQSWLRQPWATRCSMVQAAIVVLAVEAGLAVTSLPRLARLLHVPLAADRDDPVVGVDNFGALETLTAREQRAHWAVDWFLERWLFDGTCLRRSLAFGWFIRARQPVLRIGMIDDGGTVAHAWVEAEGRAFDAVQVTGGFTIAHPSATAGLDDESAPAGYSSRTVAPSEPKDVPQRDDDT